MNEQLTSCITYSGLYEIFRVKTFLHGLGTNVWVTAGNQGSKVALKWQNPFNTLNHLFGLILQLIPI
jgi:hypothetical protein